MKLPAIAVAATLVWVTCAAAQPVPTIDVDKSADAFSRVGDSVSFTITITNTTADQALTLTTIDDPLLGGSLIGAAGVTTDCPTSPATLAAGAMCTITASRTTLAGDPDPLVNTVSVTATNAAGGTVTDPDSSSTDLVVPNYTVTKDCVDGEIDPGDSANFRIRVSNTGNVELVVDIVDTLLGINMQDVLLGTGICVYDSDPADGCLELQGSVVAGETDVANTVNASATLPPQYGLGDVIERNASATCDVREPPPTATPTITPTATITPPATPTRTPTLTPTPGRPAPVISGAGAGGGPHVKTFGAQGEPGASFFAFGPRFLGGVRVAGGDVNGDGRPDIITAAGPGAAPRVRIFDANGNRRATFLVFDSEFRGGVSVAGGDWDGDGRDDIIVGSGPGATAHVKVIDGLRGTELASSFPFGGFTGGVVVGVGDVNGDGRPDIITGTGSGDVPTVVKVIDGRTDREIRTFFPYGGFAGGVSVAVGDVNGDGRDDIITGAGAGGGPHVKVFDGSTGAESRSFFAYSPGFLGGVNVAAGDVNGDGIPDIIVGKGPGSKPHVKVFDGVTNEKVVKLLAYDPAFRGGVFVGGD